MLRESVGAPAGADKTPTIGVHSLQAYVRVHRRGSRRPVPGRHGGRATYPYFLVNDGAEGAAACGGRRSLTRKPGWVRIGRSIQGQVSFGVGGQVPNADAFRDTMLTIMKLKLPSPTPGPDSQSYIWNDLPSPNHRLILRTAATKTGAAQAMITYSVKTER